MISVLMKPTCITSLLLLSCALFCSEYPNVVVAKTVKPIVQALLNLEGVCQCVLHHSGIVYVNYGCYCGFGGSGEPIDDIDRCCMYHDHCYDDAVNSGICSSVIWEYLNLYDWKCANSTAVCSEQNTECQAALCECDVAAAKCWGQYPVPSTKLKCVKQ